MPSATSRTPTSRSRTSRWWLGGEHPNLETFLAEEFGELRHTTRLLLFAGACLSILRAVVSIALSSTPNDSLMSDVGVRLGVATVLGLIAVVFTADRKPRTLAGLLAFYLFISATGNALWVARHDVALAYALVPFVILAMMGMVLWNRLQGLVWPALAVVVPAVWLISTQDASRQDWAAFIFYLPIGVILGMTMRRARLRAAFTLFLFRENLQDQASRDPLTGLLNRNGLNERAAVACQKAWAARKQVCVAFFDLDLFKQINDKHGHAAGDRVLVQMASILTRSLSDRCVVARLGGEEFLAVLAGMNIEQAKTMVSDVRQRLAGMPEMLGVTVSVGLSILQTAEPLSKAMHRADLAMLQAKEQGRDRVCLDTELPG